MKHFWQLILATSLTVSACAQTNASATFRFKGTVVDAAGQPVTGATIESYAFPRNAMLSGDVELKQSLTAAESTFEIAVAPQGAVIIARKAGMAPAWRMFWNLSSDPEGRLTLGQPGTLQGKVVDQDDKPVADAEVFVALANMEMEAEGGGRTSGFLSGKPARECFSTRTSAEGRFRFENFPTNAAAELSVRVAGKALRQEDRESWNPNNLSCRAGQEDVRLVVEPAGIVTGKIVAEGQAQPPRARLTLQVQRNGFHMGADDTPVESQADGTFRFENVAAGSYRVQAVFGTNALPDWVAESVSVSVEAGKTAADVEVKANAGGCLLVSVVDKKQHQPVAQAQIGIYQEGYQTTTRSDKSGQALFRLPAGDYQVSVSQDSGGNEHASMTVEAGKTNQVEMQLAAPARLRGIVRRPDGQPAAGVELRIVGGYGGGGGIPKTDAEGKFDLPFNPQQYGSSERVYCLFARDAGANLAAVQDVDEDSGALELKLAPGLTLAGRAECNNAPATNATAALVFWSGNSGMHLYGLTTGTNADGKFEIPGLPPGRRYGMYVSAPGCGQKYVAISESVDEAKRVELDPVDLKLANLKVAGQVVDADDKPVAGASVHLSGEGQPSGSATTDRQGKFTFEKVCEGGVRLYVNSRNSSGNQSAEGGDTNVVVKLGENAAVSASSGSRANKLKGVVTDPEGQPLKGVEVAVFPSHSGWAKTGTNGAFSLNWTLQSWQRDRGEPWLVLRHTARNLAAAEAISEETTNLNITLKPAITVTGRVEGPQGALTNAEIGIWLQACQSYENLREQPFRTDKEGRYELKCLPFGPKYIIYASAKDHGRSQVDFEPESETNRVELEVFSLKLADQVIAGQVINEKDKPASGVHVSLSGDDQPSTSATTDRQGRFQFKVCEGTVRLYANGDNSYANSSAEAGDTNVVLQLRGYGSSSSRPAAPKRASLKGKPLPDLATAGLAADAAPAGKPVLLCLLDGEQRPSRRFARQLGEKLADLRQQGLTVLAVQAVPAASESLQSWTNSAPLPFPLGVVTEKSPKTAWATGVASLPWLILRDAKGNVSAEGFPYEELEAKIKALSE